MPFEPTPDQLIDIVRHAAQLQPAECCGVIAAGRYWPITNRAAPYKEANATFVMDRAEYCEISVQHRIEAIVHSHVYVPPIASDGDKTMCEKLGLPWLIVNWPTGAWKVFEPSGFRAPLVGRQWAYGSLDCYTVVRDGLHDYAGIELPDYERDWLWWKEGGNLIADHFAEAGFVQLPEGTKPKHCDVFGMQVSAPVVNHLGLFLAPDAMIHQLMGRLSVREVYGGFYQMATRFHLRHRSLLP